MLLFATTQKGSPYIILIYVVLFGGLYFFFLRPRSRKQKAQRLEARQVEVGDRARTIGGMIGTVVSRTDEAVTLRTAGGTDIEFVPSAIAGKHVPPVAASTGPEDEHEEPSHEGDDK